MLLLVTNLPPFEQIHALTPIQSPSHLHSGLWGQLSQGQGSFRQEALSPWAAGLQVECDGELIPQRGSLN